MFKSGSQSSSLASVGLSDYETIYEKVSKSIVMRKWMNKLNNLQTRISEGDDHDFEVVENNDYYYSNFAKFFLSDVKTHLLNCTDDVSSEQFIDLELILLDVDDFDNWKIVLPARPIPEVLSDEVITSSSNLNYQDNRLSVSLNSGNFKRASVRLADHDDLIKITEVTNLKTDYFSHVRFAVRIFGLVLCFFEDSLVYLIEKTASSAHESKSSLASKRFKIPVDRKLTTKVMIEGIVRVVSQYNSSRYFDLISINSIRFVMDIFSLLGSKKIFKEFPTIIPSIEEFWNVYYYYRSKYLGGDYSDAELQKEKEEQTKKKKYIDIDEMPEWEIPLFKYTVPKDVFKKLKKEKNWKSDSLLIVSYKQLHLILSNILEVIPDFKDTYPFDYVFLKNLDRKCWFNHYYQLELDPIMKLSSYIINENSVGCIPEPVFLKNNPFISYHITKPPLTDYNQIRSLKPKDKAINVLILDGGGIKGLNLISICEEMEKRLQKKMCEIFDLICGTSTGAILAKLFQIGLTCEECKKIYHQLGKQIFKMEGNISVTKTLMTMKGKAWYDEKQLEMFFKKFVGTKYINNSPDRIPMWFALSTLTPLSEDTKKVVMRTHTNNPVEGVEQEFYNDLLMHAESTPFIFRSYSDPWRFPDNKRKHPDFYLGTIHGNFIHDYKALRCTSAAPLYFKEMNMGERAFVDGACVNNNPSVVSAFEAKQIWPDHSKFIFVSIGTGLKKSQENATTPQASMEEELNFVNDSSPKNKPKQSTGILGNVKKNLAQIYGLVDLQLSSEKQHKQMLTQVELMKETRDIYYYRFNTPGLGDFDLDIVEDATLKDWEEKSKAYISELKEMEEACKVLSE
ncbi:predicted protein [Naegleria gruberi]|uniref:Predicted protein n=1 Tax=Naegleria gruberi TaxID=5762 RepID=D2VMA6_NAEGR|nr:uncharacterized protein NAEGRDRAFT_70067 [Naegleria gruberi]EFC42029.1 predicted protein [Naegleria gruberi]|eukprot:XP_002674773.1 predicted protein [Naegleria gruberi strain NEG-M]